MRRFRAPALIALLLSLAAACAQDAEERAAAYASDMAIQAAATITEADYMRRMWVIAHDSMRGRDTPSPELDATADWIAREFTEMGLQPGGEDGTFIQRYAIETVRADLGASSVRVDGGGTLTFGDDLIPAGSPRGGEYPGGVILVTGVDGDVDAEADRIAGRHVIYMPPPDAGREAFGVQRGFRTLGASSVITISHASDMQWDSMVSVVKTREGVRVGGGGSGTGFFVIREAALMRLLGELGIVVSGADAAMTFEELPGVEMTLTSAVEVVTQQTAPNVIGLLPGSDPELADEYVVYSAHMDHVGVRQPDADGDSIWNGADDDASGTVGVIEVAEAFASMETAPRRSILFLIVSGEEKGLWGSAYFARNPTVRGPDMVANLNADMIGRNWSDTIVAIGKEHSDLGETMNAVNEAHPELNMTAIDDIWPEERFYSRSDHFNFARRGVPILFFFNGTHEDYHGRNDEVDRIDGDKATRISQLLFYVGYEVAQRTEPPQWDPASREQIVTDPFPGS